MEPALIIVIAFSAGYLLARDVARHWVQKAYDDGYQQALNDVGQAEDEIMRAAREQAQLN